MPFKKLILQSLIWRGLYFFTVLLLNVLVARFFRASGSGWIYYLSNWYAFIILIISFSMESGMGFFASRNDISVLKLGNLSFVWSVLTGIAVFTGCLIYVEFAKTLPVPKLLLFVSCLGYVCGNLLTNFASGIFYAKKNFRLPNIICIGCNILLILVLFVALTGVTDIVTPAGFLFLYFTSFYLQGLVLLAALIIGSTRLWKPSMPSSAEMKRLFRFSLTAFAANILFFLVYRVDYWFVKNYCSALDLGNYIQVSKLGQMIILLPSIMASAVFPMVAGGGLEAVDRGIKQLSRMILISMGSLCAFLAVTGYWIFPLIFGPTFSHMYVPYLLLIPGFLSISILTPLSAYYGGKNMVRVNVTGSLLGFIFIIVADAIYVPLYGVNAAAVISSIGYGVCLGYGLLVFKREYKTSVRDFFSVRFADIMQLKHVFSKAW